MVGFAFNLRDEKTLGLRGFHAPNTGGSLNDTATLVRLRCEIHGRVEGAIARLQGTRVEIEANRLPGRHLEAVPSKRLLLFDDRDHIGVGERQFTVVVLELRHT